ncbi:MAG: sodium:proton antiporter NhaD, partial [Deltaproteobacteria bacterium]|nr:sodium:proton antiporter NhaD [Deltaproteobacteria bacterium]
AVHFWEFFRLFIPAAVNFLVPAFVMQFFIADEVPEGALDADLQTKKGGGAIVVLFLFTILTTVFLHLYLHIPAFFGMLLGLTYLTIYDYFLQQRNKRWTKFMHKVLQTPNDPTKYSVFDGIAQAEWDTLFFFYGVIMAVGGLGFIGYLEWTSEFMYNDLGHTTANVLVGVLSALVDNIPVMFSVLAMHPDMSTSQWLLVTLSAGVGGSMLSVGSAAGVAIMGQAKGHYTFMQHLKWTPVIILGFAASVGVHLLLNGF